MDDNKEFNAPEIVTGDAEFAVVASGTDKETRLPLQVLQSIYHEITGKTESLIKTYDQAFKFEFNDLEQLNLRLTQACEQYNVSASNMSVTVYYTDDTKETFSSFDRFRGFNAGNTSPVESILLQYNYMIVLPKVKNVQSYSVEIRIVSRTIVSRKIEKQQFITFPKIIRMMGQKTAWIEIKYIDYAVARNILHVLDNWLNGVPQTKTSKIWKRFHANTEVIPYLTRYFTGGLVSLFIIGAIPYYLTSEASITQLASFIVIAFVSLFGVYKLSQHLGRGAERSFDRWE